MKKQCKRLLTAALCLLLLVPAMAVGLVLRAGAAFATAPMVAAGGGCIPSP